MSPSNYGGDHFAASRRRAVRTNQNDQIAQMAEMGAERLAQLGPVGEKWAAALRRDPKAAMGFAKLHGGMGEIEKGLRNAMAAQQSAEARGVQMDPMALNAFRQGPQAWAQYQQGNKFGAEGEDIRRKSNFLWGGGQGQSQGQGQPQGQGQGAARGGFGNLDDLELRLAIGKEDPAKIREVRDRARYSSKWKHGELISQKTAFEKRLLPFDDLESQVVTLGGLNPEIPLDVLQMVNMFQRNIDEGIVRGEDVKLQQFATMSGWEAFKAKAISMVDSGQAIPTEMGRKLQKALRRQLRDKSVSMNAIVDDIEDYADANNWGDSERAVAIPRQLQARKNEGRIEGLEQQVAQDRQGATLGRPSSQAELMNAQKGDLVYDADGVPHRALGNGQFELTGRR